MRLYPVFDLVGAPIVALTCAATSAAESAHPLRPRTQMRRARWPANAAFGALAALVVRAAIVPATQACARLARRHRFGLLRWLPVPPAVRTAIAVLALDYSMYLWHRALHAWRPLWRFHAVHHADRDLDATTALRFHIGELAASLPFRCAQVLVLGVEPRVVLGYEIAMQSAALFHHSNVALPRWVDESLSQLVVTPRMHGVHHSAEPSERASNWSVVLSVWDRLHRTRRVRATQPRVGL